MVGTILSLHVNFKDKYGVFYKLNIGRGGYLYEAQILGGEGEGREGNGGSEQW